ncbi:flagellar motor protein MotB [uncultured Croceicoccus sp.]|uniref:flagellar motor protein MotB n=1 Tax=uncultured Croceicoccus sp. TaxID=1295329 RepID=UPI002629110F|nr:flagellar motor protein MotB [uncultured Croceicoccus sp.]
MATAPALQPAPVEEPVRPIIVKKVVVQAAGHHGGAWKVAYADFVTAMMAFFLLLWLLGATTEKQKQGLADYFTPTLVNLKENAAGSNGLLKGDSLNAAEDLRDAKSQTSLQSPPRDADAPTANVLRERIEQRLRQSAQLRDLARQVRVMETPEGIRIDLVDDADFSMFALGTTVLTDRARALVDVIAKAVSQDSAPIIVRGHTDALKWKPGLVANNWSLSTGRAEATRQELMRNGVAQTRFRRIEGVADMEPLIADNPADPRNRRISVLLLR